MLNVINDYGPELLRGTGLAVILTLVSMALAMGLGLGIALLNGAPFALARFLARTYIDFFRGTPLLLQLFFSTSSCPRSV